MSSRHRRDDAPAKLSPSVVLTSGLSVAAGTLVVLSVAASLNMLFDGPASQSVITDRVAAAASHPSASPTARALTRTTPAPSAGHAAASGGSGSGHTAPTTASTTSPAATHTTATHTTATHTTATHTTATHTTARPSSPTGRPSSRPTAKPTQTGRPTTPVTTAPTQTSKPVETSRPTEAGKPTQTSKPTDPAPTRGSGGGHHHRDRSNPITDLIGGLLGILTGH
ncbi:hypothetical protein ACIB24_03900 [Spongisporangium articulatum]|uniref:Uncharacterized protein n=1 Tax=Spongisporangium articulatum TaxID=3362603 RepID=A0ABW8AIK6_9ACTN